MGEVVQPNQNRDAAANKQNGQCQKLVEVFHIGRPQTEPKGGLIVRIRENARV